MSSPYGPKPNFAARNSVTLTTIAVAPIPSGRAQSQPSGLRNGPVVQGHRRDYSPRGPSKYSAPDMNFSQHHAGKLALLLGFLGAAGPIHARANYSPNEWLSLPVPALCRPATGGLQLPAILDGYHIQLNPSGALLNGRKQGHYLPIANFLRLLELDAQRNSVELFVTRNAPPVLVRGDSKPLGLASGLGQELDRMGRSRRIQLRAALVPNTNLEPPPYLQPSAGDDFPRAGSTAESNASFVAGFFAPGEEIVLGSRREQSFLSSYDVNVATGGGVSDPVFGSLRVGQTAHLCSYRLGNGEAVFVEGLLDLSELIALEKLDPKAADYGLIEAPKLRSVQVQFSSRLTSGSSTRVELKNLPLSNPNWTLWIWAEAGPLESGRWRLADLSFFERELELPEIPKPGGGIQFSRSPQSDASRMAGLGAGAIWSQIDSQLSRAGSSMRSSRPPVELVPGLFLAPSDESQLWAEMTRFVEASERAQAATSRTLVQAGAVSISLPIANGHPFRVMVATESTALVDFDTEIAPEFWMSSPVMERRLDGFLIQGLQSELQLDAHYWFARSKPASTLEDPDTGHGRLVGQERQFQGGRVPKGRSLKAADPGRDKRSLTLVGNQGFESVTLSMQPEPN